MSIGESFQLCALLFSALLSNTLFLYFQRQTEIFTTANATSAKSSLQNATGAKGTLFGDLIFAIQQKGTSTLAVEFIGSISKVSIFTKKECMDELDSSKSPNTTSVNLRCPSGQKPKPNSEAFTYNDLGLYDDAQEKKGFYFAVGPTIISGGFGVGGRAEVTANVGDVIEAKASLQASLTGDLFLSLNEFGGYLRK